MFLLLVFLLGVSSASAATLTAGERNERATFVAQSENARATYARRVDDVLLGLRRDIDDKNAELVRLRDELKTIRTGSAHRAQALQRQIDALLDQIADAQTRFADELARRDADFARERTMLLSVGDDLISTPEGAAALARYNAGGPGAFEAADTVLAALAAARDHARLETQRLANAADLRARAALALDARGKGLTTTELAIGRYETVVAAAPEAFADWIVLAQLYRDANRLDDSIRAARSALACAMVDADRAHALIEQGDALMLQARDDAALQSFGRGWSAMKPLAGMMDSMRTVQTPEQARAAAALMRQVTEHFAEMLAVFQVPRQVEQAASLYRDALRRLPETDLSTTVVADRAAVLDRLGANVVLAKRAATAVAVQGGIIEFGQRLTVLVEGAIATRRFDEAAAQAMVEQIFAPILARLQNPTLFQEATGYLESARALRAGLAARDPASLAYPRLVADSEQHLGAANQEQGKTSDALVHFDRSLSLRRSLATRDPRLLALRRDLADTLLEIGSAHASARNSAAAVADAREARRLADDLIRVDPTSADYQRLRARALGALATAKADGVTWPMVVEQYEAMRAKHMLAPADEQPLALARFSVSDPFAASTP